MPELGDVAAEDDYAEFIARHIARLAKGGLGMVAPIGPKPAHNRARFRVRLPPIAAPAAPKAAHSIPISAAANARPSCGAKLTIRKRVYCDQCLPTELGQSGALRPRDSRPQGRQDRRHARRRLRSHDDA